MSDTHTVTATPAWRERLAAVLVVAAAAGIVPDQTPQAVDAVLAGGAALVTVALAAFPGAKGRIARRFGRRV